MQPSSFVLTKDLHFTDAVFYGKAGDIITFTPPSKLVAHRGGELMRTFEFSKVSMLGFIKTGIFKPVEDTAPQASEPVEVTPVEVEPQAEAVPMAEVTPVQEPVVVPTEPLAEVTPAVEDLTVAVVEPLAEVTPAPVDLDALEEGTDESEGETEDTGGDAAPAVEGAPAKKPRAKKQK